MLINQNSRASDTSCKYMHDLVKCPLRRDLFWLLWTFLIVFLLYLFLLCACVDADLGVNQREIAEGAEASANHLSWCCNMYSGGEVPSSGNSRLSAWKRTKGRCYLSSHSHTWDMRWHIRLSSAHPYFSGVVILWQQATEANCVGSRQTGNLHGPPFVCLFWHSCLIFFLVVRGQWHGIGVGSGTAEPFFLFFPRYWTHSSHHLIEACFFRSSPMLKHSRNPAFLLHVTQFFIIFS